MPLTPGTSLGPYEVVAPLGEGGMGQVYRARDTRLGRDIALKIVPDAFATDAERLARFEREARTLAALNHPNIAQVYGFESLGAPPVRALVMELVEGQDLSALIAHGPLPIEDVLPIARQLADALEAAHDAGIVHRDLKPANIKVRDGGTVKVLDFGLAKATDVAGRASDTMNSPTLTARATEMGVILGTAAYMAPEQARGRVVDRRADIWAFGAVLYEMLTGRRAFAGDDISDTLVAVIRDDPEWTALPANLPAGLRRLLHRCLEKDPRKRLSAIGDARFDLDEKDDARVSASAAPPRTRAPVLVTLGAVAAAIVLTAAATMWLSGLRSGAAPAVRRLTVLAPGGQTLFRDSANQAVSPDGSMLAFITGLSREESALWIRSLDTLEARRVDDSNGAQLPFWSPDSRRVAFFAGSKLRVVAAVGGRPQDVCEAADGRGATWGADNVIVMAASNAGPLTRVSANGGAPVPVTALDAAKGETGHRFPYFLPDGKHFLYAALPARGGLFEIYAGGLDSADRQLVASAENAPIYAEPGYLIFSRKGVLVAQPFDAARRTVSGEPVPLGDMPGEMNVQYTAGPAASISRSGALSYLASVQMKTKLQWLDQTGKETDPVAVPAGPFTEVAVAPDGRHAVVTQLAAPAASLWWVDMVRGGLTPLVETGRWNSGPVWSPDSQRVAYGSDKDGPTNLYVRKADSADPPELLYGSPTLFKYPMSWSRDGTRIVYTDLNPETNADLWTVGADKTAKPEPFLRTRAAELFGAISPDGRWMAYISDEAGRPEAYVQSFPTASRPHRVTTDGTLDWGLWWKSDGSQLLILSANRELMLIDVRTLPQFSTSPPRVIGRLRWFAGAKSVDATPDLRRLLALVPDELGIDRSFTIVLDWRAALAGR